MANNTFFLYCMHPSFYNKCEKVTKLMDQKQTRHDWQILTWPYVM